MRSEKKHIRAKKLASGDEIRVISPATSLGVIGAEQIQLARRQLEKLGLTVSFSKNAYEKDDFDSSSTASRIEDIHSAFLDPNVKGILTTLGGYNCNQLLRGLDYSLIEAHPKRLCGYSDITALGSAIYAQTGLITYSGPHFSTFAMRDGNAYTIDHFQKMMMDDADIQVQPSEHWSDDTWYLDQDNRLFEANDGPYMINSGEAEGIIIGGNLCTLNLLQGTEFMPRLEGSILFLEDDFESHPQTFDRDLQSLIHQPGFDQVKGLVIGRFQRKSRLSRELLRAIIQTKQELKGIPVIADANFGHTSPLFTFPVGGLAVVKASSEKVELLIKSSIFA